MVQLEVFDEGTVEALAKVLGECGSGSDISRVLASRGLEDRSGESTKWRRLYWVFLQSQQQYRCANQIVDFIGAFLIPSRFVGKSGSFESFRSDLNQILSFHGLEYGRDGQFRKVAASRTLDEAERRAQTIRNKFAGRALHPEVLKYCRAELMQENYFHAVFEATKGLAQRIRDLTDIQLDGTALVDKVFSVNQPILAFNTLQTETEQSEHKGFSMLLKGCFSAVRNPLAHGPKILWSGEDDTADYLTFISLLHRKLDGCVKTRLGNQA